MLHVLAWSFLLNLNGKEKQFQWQRQNLSTVNIHLGLIQLYVTSPPSKNFFSNAQKGASVGRSFWSRKNSFFLSGLSTAIWGRAMDISTAKIKNQKSKSKIKKEKTNSKP